MQRATNQDQALARRLENGCVLLAVADGVGGARGGEVASADAISAIEETLLEHLPSDPERSLRAAIAAANLRVYKRAGGDPDLAGMASTAVIAIIDGSTAWIANVGDSRAYRCHDGELEQLTEDDSWVAEQVRSGALTEEEAERSPYRNAITRAIGIVDELEIEPIVRVALDPADTLLLCSDGLYRPLDATVIAGVLQREKPEKAAQELIRLANKAGGPDNIAVAIYRPA